MFLTYIYHYQWYTSSKQILEALEISGLGRGLDLGPFKPSNVLLVLSKGLIFNSILDFLQYAENCVPPCFSECHWTNCCMVDEFKSLFKDVGDC